MNDSTRPLYSHVGADRAAAVGLPREMYLDPAVFDAEVRRVFEAGWLPVARSSAIANPGDYRSVDLLGTPLVVSRDEAGAVHVLSRVCRHRGMPVVDGSGNRKDFSCPYHLWRYGLDGRFVFAPAMDGSAAFDKSKCDLPRVAHTEWGGWVFANISGDAAPLAPALEPLTARLRRVDPAQFVTAATLEFDSPWNWKVMVENFLESYHHIGPHANTLQQTNPGFGTYATDAVGEFTILENPAIDGGWPFVVACIFPWTLIAITESEVPFGVWYEFDRVRHDRFLLRVHVLLVPEQAADAAFVAYLTEQVRIIHVEDIAVCDGVQRGLHSALYESGPLSRLEGCLWHFHRYLQRCFAAR
ncbi:MAG TPA: aromatic ring-hydroxylating dioxygenase subunit alpha [Pseudomonadales bacterium]|nr:aromatic ring-hydroxylating dioxygenase subunit alpha [Pseudomonadales bacterium]